MATSAEYPGKDGDKKEEGETTGKVEMDPERKAWIKSRIMRIVTDAESSEDEESDEEKDPDKENPDAKTERPLTARSRAAKKKLKEPQICRVFFSSPFRGMEQERELLTKQYFPIFQSMCAAQGVQFIPVDMRWGISHELSTNAKTIEICLREMDRSDIFVGFFGQVSNYNIQGGITPMADSVMCMPVTVNFAT